MPRPRDPAGYPTVYGEVIETVSSTGVDFVCTWCLVAVHFFGLESCACRMKSATRSSCERELPRACWLGAVGCGLATGGKVAKERGLSLYQREIEAVRGINQLLRGELADVRRQLQAQRVKYLALLEDYNHLAKENGNEK